MTCLLVVFVFWRSRAQRNTGEKAKSSHYARQVRDLLGATRFHVGGSNTLSSSQTSVWPWLKPCKVQCTRGGKTEIREILTTCLHNAAGPIHLLRFLGSCGNLYGRTQNPHCQLLDIFKHELVKVLAQYPTNQYRVDFPPCWVVQAILPFFRPAFCSTTCRLWIQMSWSQTWICETEDGLAHKQVVMNPKAITDSQMFPQQHLVVSTEIKGFSLHLQTWNQFHGFLSCSFLTQVWLQGPNQRRMDSGRLCLDLAKVQQSTLVWRDGIWDIFGGYRCLPEEHWKLEIPVGNCEHIYGLWKLIRNSSFQL